MLKVIQQLQALWSIANDNFHAEEFLNNHPQKELYCINERLNNPIGSMKDWKTLDEHLEPFKQLS